MFVSYLSRFSLAEHHEAHGNKEEFDNACKFIEAAFERFSINVRKNRIDYSREAGVHAVFWEVVVPDSIANTFLDELKKFPYALFLKARVLQVLDGRQIDKGEINDGKN